MHGITAGPTRRGVLQGGAALAAAALAGPARAADAKVIRFALAAQQPNALDPAIGIQGEDNDVTRQIFDALIDPPYGTFDLAPEGLVMEAAESLEISKDSRTYTVTLRQGMLFHKGYGEVTADDAKFTFDRLRDPATGSGYRIFYDNVDAITALDKYRLQITLKQPDPTFYASAMIARGALIVPRKAVEKLGDGFRHTPVGSGPFEFEAFDTDRGVILKPFAQYHRGAPQVDGVEFRYVPDSTARTLGFIKGELDIIEGVRLPGWTDDIRKQAPHAQFDLTRPGSTNVVSFNMTHKPFDDARVRQAVRYAIDRSLFAQAYGDLYGDVWGINPPEYPGAFDGASLPQDLRYDYDPAKSKQLLAAAGFPHGFAFDNFISEREDYQAIMLMMQEMLRKVGITMRLQTVDHTTYHTRCLHDACIFPMNSETTAPVGSLLLQGDFSRAAVVSASGGGRANFSHYGQVMPGIDDKLAQLLAEPDLQRRETLTRQAEIQVLQDMPGWNALSLHWVFARNPRLDLGFPIKASYAYFTLWKARFV
jgi:peptide/nickel transport system substrate-binding protein